MKFEIKDFISKLVSFQSVSADSSKASQVDECADFLARSLNSFGFDAKINKTALHPIVFATRNCKSGKPKIRILCYGHYDVQPVDPIAKWKSDPFKTVVKDGKIWGRGTADNKGPFSCLLGGLLSFLEKNPDAPADFGIMLEGEEEIGSPSMADFISKNRELIGGYDLLLLSDTSAASINTPIVTIGLRGTGSFDAVFKGPNTDIHSGMFGGAVYNPIQAMFEVCASLHDENGLVNIPNFYDGLSKPSAWELEEIAKSPFGENDIKKLLGVKSLYSQKGYSPAEALRVLPTVEFTGAGGGYQGEGSKSVIPSECFCKISCRTVAPQKTSEVIKLVQKTMAERAPKGVEVSFVDYDACGDSYFIDPRNFTGDRRGGILASAFKAVDECSEKAFGNKPVYLREGASIPLISRIKSETGLDSIMLGLFTAEDNLHAPNEGFPLAMIDNAMRYYELFFNSIANHTH